MLRRRMDIDLAKYTEAELLELNRRIVQRLKTMREERCRSTMTEFRVGERVSFQPECGHEVVGTIVRLNRKSVTIVTADGGHWRVAPAPLKKASLLPAPAKSQIDEVPAELIGLAALQQRDRGKA
jgi:hypothetical protein